VGDRRGTFRVSMEGKQEGRRTLGRCSRKWEVNFKVDFQEIGWEGVNLIDLPQGRAKW